MPEEVTDHRAPEKKTEYAAPALERLGAAADLTRTRSMRGRMDGGMGGMNRTG